MMKFLFFLFLLLLPVTAHATENSQEKVYIVAMSPTWPPMEFLTKDRQITGYTPEYIQAVADAAGFSIEIKNIPWEGIFAGLLAKKYDIIASSATITEERKKSVDFSDPYYETTQVLVTKKAAPLVTNIDQLAGKVLGSQIGTTSFFTIKKDPRIIAKTYDTLQMAMSALELDKLDGVVCDDATAINFVLQNPTYAEILKINYTFDSTDPDYYGFVVQKGNQELLDKINAGIKKVQESGKAEELRDKWTKAKLKD